MNNPKSFFRTSISVEKLLAFTYGVLIALLGVFAVSSYIAPFSVEGFDGYNFVTLSRNWEQVLPNGETQPIPSLPADLYDKLGEEIVVRRQLPGLFLLDGPVLMIRSNHQIISARIDGEEIYRYDYWASSRYGLTFPPVRWLSIPLRSDYAGKVIELSLTRLQEDTTETVSDIFLGDRTDIIYFLIRRNIFPLICGAVTLLVGAFFLVRQMIWASRKVLERRSLYVGLILLLLSTWLLCSSDVRQVFFDNILYARNMEFLSLMMLPVPIILSVNYSERGKFQTVAYALCGLVFLSDLVILLLVLVGIRNILEMLWLIIASIAVAGLFILVSFFIIAFTDAPLFRSLRIALFSYGTLFLFGFGEYLNLLLFSERHQGICMAVGILFYTAGLTAEQSRDQRKLLEQVERAESENRAKSDFLASMSHEIRTPINAVLGMDEMILREATDPAVLDYAADIRHAGRHLLSLIDDILDISRIESGRMEIAEGEYDLEVLLADISDLIRVQAEEKGLAFETRILSVIPNKLRGDAPRIRQIAINILNNAVKYTRRGRVVFSIDAIPEEEAILLRSEALIQGPPTELENPVYLRMSVRDTGIGMRQEEIPSIFDSFQRLDAEVNAGVQGTGLGLPIVSTLVRLMHGFLMVKSVYGIGSQFTVVLPQEELSVERFGSFTEHPAKPKNAADRDKPLFRAPTANVLAVDDNAMNLRLLKALLRRTQVRLTTCDSGKECLKLAQTEHFDLILMDHLMPEMDGIETLHRLRELPGSQCAGIPVIVLTANAITGMRERYLASGFNDYLSKPIRSEDLEAMMMRYLPQETLLPPEDAEASAGDGAAGAAAEPPEIPDWLNGLDEIDVSLGLRYCGTPDIYLDTLAIYAKNAEDFSGEIEACRSAGDNAGTVIKVHALKSTSLAIGADSLSKLAASLEAAGKKGDVQTLNEGLDELLSRYRALGQALIRLVKRDDTAEADLAPISDEQLRDTYNAIRKLAAEFECDRAAAMIESLCGCRLSDSERERCNRLRHAAENFEWDQIEAILS